MRTLLKLGTVVVAVVVAMGVVSCHKSPDVVVQKAMDQSSALCAQGQAEAAVAVLRRVYDNKDCAAYRQRLLGAMLSINLSTGRVESAQSLFREVVAVAPDEAASVIGMIEQSLFNGGRFDDLATWCASLQSMAFKDAPLTAIADYHLKALEAAGKLGDVVKVLPGYVSRLPEAAGLGLIERQFALLMRTKNFEAANELVALVSGGTTSPARIGLAARMRVDLLVVQGKRADAESFFKQQAATWPETDASAILRRLVDCANRERQAGASDALCRFVLDAVKDRPVLRDTAGEIWVANAQALGSVNGVVERLVGLRKDGLKPAFLAGQVDRQYGFIMERGAKPQFGPLLDLCQSFVAELNDDDRARVSSIMLDFCFYLERFDTALAIVEKGIPGRDEKWKKTLAAKVRGHLLLQQGKPHEAVASFREFMGYIAKEEGDQIDPIKGTRVTKEMILGLNAKRIGDILAGAADKEGAAKAYQEARDDYTTALKSFAENSAEYAKLKADIAAIPTSP